MKRDPITIGADDSLSLAQELMAWAGVRVLPVLREGAFAGMLTEHDLLVYRVRNAEVLDWRQSPVAAAAGSRPLTATPDEPIMAVAHRMAEHRVGALPVLNDRDLVGLVTADDVLGSDVSPRAPATACEIMTRMPARVHAGDTVLDAVAIMSRRRVRHLPVVDGDARVIGMISDRDVRTAVGDSPRSAAHQDDGSRIASLRVRDIMTTPAVTVQGDHATSGLVRMFAEGQFGALPVVDAEDRLTGIVSYVDVLRAMVS